MTRTNSFCVTWIIGPILLLTTLNAHACDDKTSTQSLQQIENASLAELTKKGTAAVIYNFRLEHCVPLSGVKDEVDFGAFLPSDETSLGLYHDFRAKGEDPLHALKHVYQIILAPIPG